ncbi:alpha,alpha-trehalose-phosphate synthase (UDP-forming) [Plastorhodobacter daqingensis]|uniref:Trehalose-6-phosphate synthase n=1 Tax=Plastorhodobacter daqingensis TaxID=1387281 RepID=A0ABW2UMQ0_9RHOB
MGRLIVVSNRVPVPDRNGNPPAGGLAVAVHAALQSDGGIWMGWSGETTEGEPGPPTVRQEGNISYVLSDLSQTDVDEYYNGFANRVLWPIFHLRLDLAEYARREMAGYFRVNRLFAERLVPMIQPDDVIWVHDYHLIPLADELRKRGVTNRIGFFLHIPWPPADIMFAMPIYDTILRSLASYDLIGFQTDYDLENFIGCLRREGCGDQIRGPDGGDIAVGNNTGAGSWIRACGRDFAAAAFPIGIDTARFASLAARVTARGQVRDMRRSLEGRALIIGVDRLDYSKGIAQRIDAYERFLQNNPDDRERVTMLQVAPKSRSDVPEYRAMQDAIATQCGQVNGRHGTINWVPIRYVNRSLSRAILAGLYREARVGLVTPLRDGMNLVAKEFVAAQDPEDPGVLVLSRFAGAARELAGGAVFCNPYDTDQTASAIAQALSMPLAERQERWQRMMGRLLDYDITHWCRDFMTALRQGTDRA